MGAVGKKGDRRMKRVAQPFTTRQYMTTNNYEIFWCRDTKIDNVDVHHHDYYELYYFISGSVCYSIEERNYALLPGDVLLISPQELHHPCILDQAVPYERIVIWLDRKYLENLSTERTSLMQCFDTSQPGHTNLIRAEVGGQRTLSMVYRTLLEESEGEEYGGDLGTQSTVVYLLITLNRMAMALTERYEVEDRSNDLVSKVVTHINNNYTEPMDLDDLARTFFVSKFYLSHEFQRLVGTSIYRYVIQRRLLVAHNLIADGVAPTTAFAHSGYRDYANFFRAFRREYGISPKDYAKAMEAKASGEMRALSF